MSVEASARASAEIRAAQFLFGAYVVLLFVFFVVTVTHRTHANVPIIIIFAVVAFAMTLGGALYLGRIRTGDTRARTRYWVPFAIACVAFFALIPVLLAAIFIALAHRRLDSPAVREYLHDQTPLPWLSW